MKFPEGQEISIDGIKIDCQNTSVMTFEDIEITGKIRSLEPKEFQIEGSFELNHVNTRLLKKWFKLPRKKKKRLGTKKAKKKLINAARDGRKITYRDIARSGYTIQSSVKSYGFNNIENVKEQPIIFVPQTCIKEVKNEM